MTRIWWGRKDALPSGPGVPIGSLDWYDGKADPLGAILQDSYRAWDSIRHAVPMGVYRCADDGHLYIHWSAYQSNVGIFGPPRSNKTVGVQTTQIITHFGPVVAMSTKRDQAELSAVAASRKGPVLHLDVSGHRPVAGLIPVAYSFVDASSTPTLAQQIGAAIAGSAQGSNTSNQEFWSQLAGQFLGAPLYAAYLGGKDMGFVLQVLQLAEAALDQMEDILTGDPRGREVYEMFETLSAVHPEAVGSIRLTALHALRIFNRPEVVKAERDRAKLDLRGLVQGDPFGMSVVRGGGDAVDDQLAAENIYPRPIVGTYATLFITCDDPKESQVVYRTFMRMLWSAVKDQHDEDRSLRAKGRRPTLLVVDELANLAPDPTYPEMIAQCADQGLLVSSSMQDLGQIEAHFGSAAKSFLTVHRERLVFPGIMNPETLNAISLISGQTWELRPGDSITDNPGKGGGPSWTKSHSDHRVPRLDPGEIYSGRPNDPKAMLHLPPPGRGLAYSYLWPMPVWAARPWPRALIASMELQANAEMTGPDGSSWPVRDMPIPELDRKDLVDGVPYLVKHQVNGADLYRRWQAMANHYGIDQQAS